jgi:hypothetical protein
MPAPKGHRAYNTSGEGGRPKKYTKEFIEKEADAFEEWMNRKESLWYEDFASQRGYDPDQLSIWAKENKRFSGVYKRAQAWQKSLLIRGGLLSKFNASITKLVLANTCGWTDKQQVSGDAVNPLTFLLGRIDGESKELVKDDNSIEE